MGAGEARAGDIHPFTSPSQTDRCELAYGVLVDSLIR